MRVLLVEDDTATAKSIELMLKSESYVCDSTDLGEDGLEIGKLYDYDIIILDLMLPDMDGYEVLRRLRASNVDTPVLILSGLSGLDAKIKGLGFGADDYLTKPFGTQELVARVRALLRRTTVTTRIGTLTRGVLRIDPERREVTLKDHVIELTSLEFDLLFFMATRPGRVYSRDALMQEVWGHDRLVDSRSIDSLISRLRRKLKPPADDPPYIQTVWGAGYRFTDG